ncbi:MAG: Asp-tRNA(Asn)/Glu-tRNA(Gln) amidotransferase subunit GatC [Hyphomonadaceae bacterium]|nr:Asp-tRNA(Asn)/Glu-tRNA(Gln) amidotransferase subunit GatC [Hyphomonadaceae bacterium]MBC6411762.1 Asp-tRNA(Asn)/Glu-tRNA(Gln) amidotransferase subunit GatC [Hyphomonadaceae bacterium]
MRDPITMDTVRKIARLSHLYEGDGSAPGHGRLDDLASELNSIMGWIEQLNEVDVESVAPMTSTVDMDAPLRRDDITDGGRRDVVLANAPKAEGGFYVVPRSVK